MSMALFSPPPTTTIPTLFSKSHPSHKPQLPTLLPLKTPSGFLTRSADNGAGMVVSAAVEEKKEEAPPPDTEKEVAVEKKQQQKESLESNGAAAKAEAPAFKDPRWVGGTWDLKQFEKDGKANWDSVIDAEVRRRKWLEDNPEASSNAEPVVFDTSIIPWFAWVKRFHLPEAELLNGRAAMIGFFMAYLVDSLTGMGLVDQMGNFFCKTLLFVAVVGVLLIRKNEDVGTLRKLLEETTFYDKQWQASWKEDSSKKE